MKRVVRAILLCGIAALQAFALAGTAFADDETPTLFASAVIALRDGRPGDAIASLEALADRGVVDAVASYDRGLAYASRARIGAEVPGDLGRAAHGFEEARDLSRDLRLVEDAARALALVRSEVARRRSRAGDPVEVDPGRSLGRTVSGLLTEDTWSAIAVASSATLAIALFVRWLGRGRRLRISGGVTAGVAANLLVAAAAMTAAARHDRIHLHEAVVVVAKAQPTDERGITTPNATPLPEGARVEVIGSTGRLARIRFGAIEVWVSSSAMREIARAD